MLFICEFRMKRTFFKISKKKFNSLVRFFCFVRLIFKQNKNTYYTELTMGSLNKALLIGRLGADPEVRYTQNNTAVATLNIATSERYKDNNGDWQEKTEWHRVVCWSRLAEVCQQYLKKGAQVYIEGSIQTRSWQDKDGQTKYTTEIKAGVLQMLDSRPSDGSSMNNNAGNNAASAPQQRSNASPKQVAESPVPSDFENFVDDDLPF